VTITEQMTTRSFYTYTRDDWANFTISGTLTTPQTFDAGGSALANVTLTSTGFTGNVTLRLIVPSGLTASLNRVQRYLKRRGLRLHLG